MEDRELLALAAKAIGLEGEYKTLRHSRRDHFSQIRHFSREAFVSKGLVWNPLDDDGDALRLAAKLHISLEFGLITLAAYKGFANNENMILALSYEDQCHSQLSRRAIVLAAAEIGKAMP